jgi:Calx-beta domain/FG-GAP repeat/Domain of unknown function (DUF4214)
MHNRVPQSSFTLTLLIFLTVCAVALTFQRGAVLAQNAVAPPDEVPLAFTEQQQLVAGDGTAFDNFGSAVAISGNTAIVGAFRQPSQNDRGAAYVYVGSGGSWSQQQKLVPGDVINGFRTGWAVAIDGDTAVVSAPRHSVNGALQVGVVYIYVRSGTTWTIQQQLTASDGVSFDEFGSAVAIKGNTVLIGAWLAKIGSSTSQGAVYVFTRSGTTWTQQQKLTAGDGLSGDQFGGAIGLTNDSAVIGARQDLGCNGCNVGPGKAYVFVRSGSIWSQQQKLTASDGLNTDAFGSAVAIDRDTVAVGAYHNDESPTTSDRGAVYVFVRSGTTWSQQQKLRGSIGNGGGGGFDHLFGEAVAVSGDTLVAGAPGWTQQPDNHRGKVFVFDRSGGAWTEREGFQAPNTQLNTDFGQVLALNGDSFIVGAPGDNIGSNNAQGDAFAFGTGHTLSIADAGVTEGNSGTTSASFTVTLSAVETHPVLVDYATADGTATGGSDYVAISGTLTFLPGETSKTISVTINGDTVFEPNETFFVNLSNSSDASLSRAQAVGTILNDDLPPTLQFSTGSFSVNEGANAATITVTRTGDTSVPVNVDYATSDGSASQRTDYEMTVGTLKFAAGETSKTFDVLIVNDVFVEGSETVNLTLSNPTGVGVLGSQKTATLTIVDNDSSPPTTNPIDDADQRFFVRQHYYDFLNRQPDQAGFDFWVSQITNCGSNQGCIQASRVSVSASFYLSIEFQQTGYLVERMYKVSYGDATGTSTIGSVHQLPVPIVRYAEFLADTQQIEQGLIVGQTGWETVLENNKQGFASTFVQRSRFTTAFPTSMTPAQFVDALNLNAGSVLSASERTSAIGLFGGAGDTSNATARAQAVRQVAENQTLNNAEFNRAFVLMQYFGYLRRNPNDPQDNDYSGYDFWLSKLIAFNGNFINAEMVKAFITSNEYRNRFGP